MFLITKYSKCFIDLYSFLVNLFILGEPHAGMREEKRSNDISHDINGLRVSMSNNNAEERNDAYNFDDDGTEYRNIEQELKDEVRPYFLFEVFQS